MPSISDLTRCVKSVYLIEDGMRVRFASSELSDLETERAAASRLPIVVIQSLRRQLRLLRAAPDERTLCNWKSLDYRVSPGRQRRIRVGDQLDLLLSLNEGDGDGIPEIMVVDVELRGKE